MATKVLSKNRTGPKSVLDSALLSRLRQLTREGKGLREIAKIQGLPESTLYTWHSENYLNIRNEIRQGKLEKMLDDAEMVSEKILSYNPISKLHGKEVVNTALVTIQQREAEYLRSMLKVAKEEYASKDVTVNVQVNLPTPIMDMSSIEEHVIVDVSKDVVEG